MHQEHITYPVLRDVSGNFVRSFGTTGVPETFVINRQGKIQALRRYQLNNTWLKQTLPPILAETRREAPDARRQIGASRRPARADPGRTALSPAAALAAHARASFTDIENDVMCVACHESLAVAQSPEAYSERSYIRGLIGQGLTKKQIENQLVAQYGPAVLGKPPAHGFNLVVYVRPGR